MNSREKELFQYQLDSEEAVIKALEQEYRAAIQQIDEKIKILQADDLTQSKIYQIEYQKALRGQIEGILEKMHGDEFSTIQQYLHDCYEDSFVGTAYSLAGQGMPFIMPIDQAAAVKAIVTDSELSEGLYDSLGVDIKKLKKSISQEITRGIASGMSYAEIARNITNVSKAPMSRAKTIARTEGHRIQEASTFDAQHVAKSKGADVVKQWDSTMDGNTRPVHRALDGQIREIDEPFEKHGKKAIYPGAFGDPAEDCNCRCKSLTRARKALDEDELQTLKERAEFFGLDKTKDFKDFKEKYMKAAKPLEKSEKSGKIVPKAITGAHIVGAYNNKNDPDGKKRDAHAERYYSSIRNGKKNDIVSAISQNTNVEAEYVSKMYDHLFINEYDLDGGHARFDSDFEIAESVQRLREGKDIQTHDITLIYHEAMEYDLMNDLGLSYEEAHTIANRSFNYQKELEAWTDENEK